MDEACGFVHPVARQHKADHALIFVPVADLAKRLES